MLNPRKTQFEQFSDGDEVILVSFTYPNLDFLKSA